MLSRTWLQVSIIGDEDAGGRRPGLAPTRGTWGFQPAGASRVLSRKRPVQPAGFTSLVWVCGKIQMRLGLSQSVKRRIARSGFGRPASRLLRFPLPVPLVFLFFSYLRESNLRCLMSVQAGSYRVGCAASLWKNRRWQPFLGKVSWCSGSFTRD